MTIRNFAMFLIITVVLAGCMNPALEPEPVPTIATIQVHFLPELSFLETTLRECSRQSPEYEIILIKDSKLLTEPSAADLSIRWGIPQEGLAEFERDTQIYRLTDLDISVITHPAMSLPPLSPHILADIFQGKIQNWSHVSADLDPVPIFPVLYPADHPLRGVFHSAVIPQGTLTTNARIVPHQEAVLKVISEQPGAIGLILEDYRSDSVQIVSVSPSLESFKRPVWAVLPDTSSPQSETFLSCVTQSLQD